MQSSLIPKTPILLPPKKETTAYAVLTRYAHLAADPIKQAAADVSANIAAALGDEATT